MGRGVAAAVALCLLAGLGPVASGTWDPAACQSTTPANDCFKNAFLLTNRDVQETQDDTQATVESGEPLGPDMANTVWWKFVASHDTSGSFSVAGSDHQAGHTIYELQSDGSLLFLDHASGWSGNPWTDFDCVGGRTYYIQGGGEEGQTGVLDLDGTACLPSPPPAPLLAITEGPARGDITLTWTSTGDGGGAITHWLVQRSSPDCSSYATVASPEGAARSHVDAGLPEAVVQCYRVAAVNSVGTGAWSLARASTPLGVPSAPQGVQATAGDGAIHLQHLFPFWDGGSAVAGLRVYGASAGEGPFTPLYETTATTSAETGLGDGVTRHYRVHAFNAFGETPHVAVSARTWAVPSPPRNVEAGWNVPLGVRLTWDPPLDDGGLAIQEYVILRGPHGEPLEPHDSVDGSTRSYVDLPSPFRAWDYAVLATNAKGSSGRSNVDCGQTIPLPPLSPLPHC